MKPADVIARARACLGQSCRYGLGKGGMNPKADWPWDSEVRLDCSGFVAWCLEVSRKTDNPWYVEQNGGWLETSAIVRDCETPFGFFALVNRTHAQPGDLLVYGDRKSAATGKSVQGHVGIVTEADNRGPRRVIHCSRGSERKYGDAIAETDTLWWSLADGIVARCAWVET